MKPYGQADFNRSKKKETRLKLSEFQKAGDSVT